MFVLQSYRERRGDRDSRRRRHVTAKDCERRGAGPTVLTPPSTCACINTALQTDRRDVQTPPAVLHHPPRAQARLRWAIEMCSNSSSQFRTSTNSSLVWTEYPFSLYSRLLCVCVCVCVCVKITCKVRQQEMLPGPVRETQETPPVVGATV